VREWHQVATFLRVRGHAPHGCAQQAGHSWTPAEPGAAGRGVDAACEAAEGLCVAGCRARVHASTADATDAEEVLAQQGEWDEVLCTGPAEALVGVSERDAAALKVRRAVWAMSACESTAAVRYAASAVMQCFAAARLLYCH